MSRATAAAQQTQTQTQSRKPGGLTVPGAAANNNIDDGASSCRGSCISAATSAVSSGSADARPATRSKKSTVSSGSAMTMLDQDAVAK